MGKFFAELKRRHVYRVAAAYAVVAWVLIQLVNNLAPLMRLPDWAGSFFLVLLGIGFAVAMIFAWTLELKAPAADGAAKPHTSGIDFVLAGALAVVIALILYEQLAPGTGARTAQQASVAAPAGIISIAVLPFANVSADPGQEFFSDGMTDEISAALANVKSLRVIARTSAFQFKGQNGDVRAVGQALGATHLIEGSVRKAGDRVRITAQLVKAGDGSQLWSETYDRQLTDIFAIQEDIAQSIAASLRVPLGLQQGETLVSNRTSDLESYQQYLRARALLRVRGPGIAQAIAILEPLVAREPNFATAWAALAFAYNLLPPPDAPGGANNARVRDKNRQFAQALTDKAEKAAQEAIRLDPRTALAYSALATIRQSAGKWVAAEDLFRQAIALDPNDADILHRYSLTLAVVGRVKDALVFREKLRALEPFVPLYNVFTASIMRQSGQYQAAISILEGLPADAAFGVFSNTVLAEAYAAEGHYDKAADALLAYKGNEVSRSTIEEAARLLRAGPQIVRSPETLPLFENELDFVYTYAGATDRILEIAEPTINRDFVLGSTLNRMWNPEFVRVRKTERFKAIVRKAGLVDYWRARGWPDLCRPMGADDFVCD